MAGIKISQLPAAALPLSGAEQIPLVQTGATVKTTVADMYAGTDGSSFVGYLPSGTGVSTSLTVQDKLRESVSVKDYGAKGDGSTDDTAAIAAAIADNGGKTIYFPPAIYRVTSTLTIDVAGTRLVTDGRATIYAPVGNFDVFHFICPTTGQYEYLNSCSLEGRFYVYTDASSIATVGAGVRLTRCNGFVLTGTYILNMAEGLVIEGGKDGRYTNISIDRAPTASDMTGIADSAVLKVTDSATAGGTYQPAWTLRFTNLELNPNYRNQCAMLVTNCDGLQMSTGYIAGARDAVMRVKPGRAGSSVAAVTINNFYLDAINQSTGSDYCVDIPDDGLASNVYNVAFTGCFMGNCRLDAVKVTKTISGFQIVGCTIANVTRTGIDFSGSAANVGDLQVVGSKLQTVNTGGSGYAIRIGNAISLNLTGNTISSGGSNAAVRIDGSVADAVLAGNNIRASTLDFQNVGTVTRLTYGSNQTALATTKALTGLRPGNFVNSDTSTLDWYEEGTFTPTISFGAGSTGITYSFQLGTYTRIGNRVMFNASLLLTSKGSSTGGMFVNTAIPYNAEASTPISMRVSGVTAGVGDTSLFAFIQGGSTQMRIDKIVAGGSFVTQLTDADVLGTLTVQLSGTYKV